MLSEKNRIRNKNLRVWFNYSSVEMLSQEWNLSKRRVQQIIQKLKDEGTIEMVVGVFDSDSNPYARPLYRRVEK